MNENINAAMMVPTAAVARTQGSAPAASMENVDPKLFASLLNQVIQEVETKPATELAAAVLGFPLDLSVVSEHGKEESSTEILTEDPKDEEMSETMEATHSMLTGWTFQINNPLPSQPEILTDTLGMGLEARDVASSQTMVSGTSTGMVSVTDFTSEHRMLLETPVREDEVASGISYPQDETPNNTSPKTEIGMLPVEKPLEADLAKVLLAVSTETPVLAAAHSTETSQADQGMEPIRQTAAAVSPQASTAVDVTVRPQTTSSVVIPLSEIASKANMGYRGTSLRHERVSRIASKVEQGPLAQNQTAVPGMVISVGQSVQPELSPSWLQQFASLNGVKRPSEKLAGIAMAPEGREMDLHTMVATSSREVQGDEGLTELDPGLATEASVEEMELATESNDRQSFTGILRGVEDTFSNNLEVEWNHSPELMLDPSTSAMKSTVSAGSEVQHTPRGVPYTAEEVVSQIIQGSHVAVRDGAVEMKLRLEPAELGRVELKIVYEQNAINTHFVAESEAVKKIIETHLPQLRNALQESGLHADNFSVSVNNGWSSSGNGQSGRQNHPFHYASQNYRWNDTGEEMEALPVETYWTGHINLKA